MKIKSTIDNEPILSNVGQVGEFRIRNSAKAFNILSSGLYANKIRAIIREYSCNAVDSHVEAGRSDVPFDVHLPSNLEPWFSVRDYGVGLDETQVRNIYTTYFESTKTATDELIGGLGLGSKSAFSYTDNFTIVAVKNNVKRVFTAFINDQGVPSIAPMGEENTTDPNGVEIRFAVSDQYDFRKFYNEAQYVYKHFKLRPVITGAGDFKFINPEYIDKDIIPGVHLNRGNGYSYAVMGNIEYPLNVPGNMDLGNVGHLLRCGLTIEFAIGELDIQASREGLSYIPETIAAIKNKLEALNSVLADRVASDIDIIKNDWEKAYALVNKMKIDLYCAAAKKYVSDNNFTLISLDRYNYSSTKTFFIKEDILSEKYNINIRGFKFNDHGSSSIALIRASNIYNDDTRNYENGYNIHVDNNTHFVINDTTTGVFERAKYHWKNTNTVSRHNNVFVIEKADKNKDMKLKSFFRYLFNPPKNQIHNASGLKKKERAKGIGKNVSILMLQRRNDMHHRNSSDMVWRDAGNIDTFSKDETFYYLPLSGFTPIGAANNASFDMKSYAMALHDSKIFTGTVYGVRKGDLEIVKNMTNWVELDSYVVSKLSQPGIFNVKSIIKHSIGFDDYFRFNYLQNELNADSPYLKLFNQFAGVASSSPGVQSAIQVLCKIYNVSLEKINITDEVTKYKNEMMVIKNRYPLINHMIRNLSSYNTSVKVQDVADYINAMDAFKKN